MDISICIQELLWEHDCVIIPGLGGFISRYCEARHHPVSHQWSPPSKTITFNSALIEDDGLLAVAISKKHQCSYAEAAGQLRQWVAQTKALLAGRQEIVFPQIGKLYPDIEGNLQFLSQERANFLASSFGLPEFQATPVLKKEDTTPITIHDFHRPSVIKKPRRVWAMAAALALLLGLGAVLGLLSNNLTIPAFQLNQAGVLSFLDQLQPSPEWSMAPKSTAAPLPEAEDWNYSANLIPVDSNLVNSTATATERPQLSPGYYVMIGAFRETANIVRAESFIQQHFPGAVIYKDTSPYFVRIGFRAGDNYSESLAKLQEARTFDTAFWLLKGN
ncbi:MAG: hypothetical protein U0T73_11120 [Chitinophagales bacterium]